MQDAEIEALKHDIERYVRISTEQANRIEQLERALRTCLLVMQHSLEQTTVMERLSKEAVNEAANALMEGSSHG
jgi:hypothetical protein